MYRQEIEAPDYTKEEILIFYNQYIQNLIDSPFEFIWLHPKEIKLINDKNRTWESIRIKDPYIDKYVENKKELGLDILNNGTYWPLSVYKENNSYFISEGVHRLESINMLIQDNEWGDKEMLCMIIPKEFDFSTHTKKEKFKQEIYNINVPMYNIKDNSFVNRIYSYLQDNKNNINKIRQAKEGEIINFEVNNLRHYYSAFKLMPRFLRHIFYYYDNTHNDRIPPNELINGKSLF